MKRLRDFSDKGSNKAYYDLREDWGLIESSLAKQYGIRIRNEKDMPWTEFCSLVSGLMSDTPLGQIVGIRAEKDPKTIKQFTPDQKRIHKEWQSREAIKVVDNPEQYNKQMDQLANVLQNLFGGG